jgi:hypothetical protein
MTNYCSYFTAKEKAFCAFVDCVIEKLPHLVVRTEDEFMRAPIKCRFSENGDYEVSFGVDGVMAFEGCDLFDVSILTVDPEIRKAWHKYLQTIRYL